jgi:sporulation protein YlmC with PRC-barrel domain
MVKWQRREKIRKEVIDGDAKKTVVQWRRKEEVIGKEVVDGDAKKIGVTKDIAWSEDGKLGLIIESGDDEFILPFPGIEKVGDVIFVKAKDSFEKVPSVICSKCKAKNLQEAKFCAKCGHALEAESHASGDKEDSTETKVTGKNGTVHSP